MENVLPIYSRPISSSRYPISEVKYWDKAMNSFDERAYKASVIAVLNYINTSLLKDKDVDGTIEILQPHGSAIVKISISEDVFSVVAPFLKITEETNQVALLRKVSEVNFGELSLAQIRLHENSLSFEYQMPLSLCHPLKVYNILREICVLADDYDDIFIERYKATFYQQPVKNLLTTEEQDIVWKQINNVLTDYKKYSNFFREKNWENYEWDISVISVLKLLNMPYVNGKLKTELTDQKNILHDNRVDFNVRKNKGSAFMQKLCEKSKEEIMKDIYHAENLISLKWRSSDNIMSDEAKKHSQYVNGAVAKNHYFDLSYYLQFTLLKFISDFNLEDNYQQAIEDVLEKVSGKTPAEAAPMLVKVFDQLCNKTVNTTLETTSKKKGFFSKLFN